MICRIKCEEPFSETKVTDNMQETSASSQAIVPVTSPNSEALAIVPVCKSKRAVIGQRRIRRPFSLPEVEALVEAVEQLGTGRFVTLCLGMRSLPHTCSHLSASCSVLSRWRDVKMLAFDNTDHRTYVDLKVIQEPQAHIPVTVCFELLLDNGTLVISQSFDHCIAHCLLLA